MIPIIDASTERDVRETIQHGLERVRHRVATAAQKVGREPSQVTIVGVTKTVDRVAVDAAYSAGLRHFGENRVQEASAKFATPLPADAALHLIGQLQTNKAKHAVRHFDVIESVDRVALIGAMERAADVAQRSVDVLIQVNIANEPQKAGCDVDDVAILLKLLLASNRLRPIGLMTIAPLVADSVDARPVFRALRHLQERLIRDVPDASLSQLSMGMSNDFEVAIEEGATMVRIGRAIFGERT